MRIRAQDENNNFTLLRLLLALAVVFGHFKLLSGIQYPHFPVQPGGCGGGLLLHRQRLPDRPELSAYAAASGRSTSGASSGCIPMYATIVLIQAGIMMAMLPNGPFSAPDSTVRYLAANLAFANFLQYDIGGVVHGLAVPGLNPSLWTLKIEIGFYAIVPLIFLAMQRWQWKALVAIFLASVAYQVIALHMGEPRYAKQLPGQMQFFVVGMALYLYARNVRVPGWVTIGGHRAVPVVLDLVAPDPTGHLRRCWSAPSCSASRCARRWCVWAPTCRTACTWCTDPILQTSAAARACSATRRPCWPIVVGLVLLLAFISEVLVERPGNEFGRRLSRRRQPGAHAGGGQCGVIRAAQAPDRRRHGPGCSASNPSWC